MENELSSNEINNSLNHLHKLQLILKEEIALREIFQSNKEELFQKIESNTYEYYKKKLSIQEIYFNNKELNPNGKQYIKYELSKDCQSELPQCIDPLTKLFFYFRNNNEMLLKLINKCDKSSYDELANFLCHFFYVDVFSSTTLNEPLLVLIYLLLERNIDDITDPNLPMQFLDSSNTFISSLLKSLLRRDDVKVYFESIVKKLVFDLEDLKIENITTNKPFIGMEIYKIKDYILNNKNLPQFKKINDIKDYRKFLTSNIVKSKVVKLFEKIKKVNSEIIKENTKGKLFQSYQSLFEKNSEEEFMEFINDNKNNEEIEETKKKDKNNSENEEKEKEKILKSKINFYENTKNEVIDKILHGKTKKSKSPIPKYRIRNYNELEKYFLSSGYYTINNALDNPTLQAIDEKLVDKEYSKQLNKEELTSKLFKAETKQMEEFLLNQIQIIKKENNNDIFTNENLLSKLSKTVHSKNILDKILILFKYNFEKMKQLIDKFIYVLIDNIPSIPYFIKCISAIIDRLLVLKFPNITKIQKNAFLGEFFFKTLLYPLLYNPNFNGIIMKISSNYSNKNFKLTTLSKILLNLYRGKLFNSNSSNESIYTIFNCYICEIMPVIFYFFDNLSNTDLPTVIKDFLEKKRMKLIERNINYEFFNYHNNEGIEHQSICITWKEYLIFYKLLQEHGIEILGDKDSKFYKTFKKLTFHDNTFKKKITNDENKNQKTFIYITHINYTNQMKDKLLNKKDKKFSFVGDDSENNEQFQLTRVKYSINTIIKNLNELMEATFQYNKNENFVKGLNNLIYSEGFSDVLKEKTIPLQWFGLYLESNIDNIPKELQKNDFLPLYELLINECQKTLNEIQKDNTLNIIFSKVVNTSKTINIINYNLIRLKNNEKKFEILNFVRTAEIKIKVIFLYNGYEFNGIKFEMYNKENQDKKEDKYQNDNNKIIICENLNQLFELFPNLSEFEPVAVLDFGKKKRIPESIMELISIVHKYIDDLNLFNHYSKDDLNDMKKEIENYIHQKLYSKIYPDMPMGDDIALYRIIFCLGWVKPENIIKNYTSINEKTIYLCTQIMNNMINETCPRKKLNEIQKLQEIIDNIIILYGYSNDNFDDILTYIAILTQPLYLSTCYYYIDMYTPKKGRELKIQIQMNALLRLINKFKNFSYKDLININEEEYEKNKQMKLIGK